MKKGWQNLKEFYLKNERHITSLALLFGFLLDNFTLTRIDLRFDNLIFFSYLLISFLGIVIINHPWREGVQRKLFINLKHYAPLFVQFAFGGLFSGFVIFYTRSASISASWPFLLVLIGLLVGNEMFRERYRRFIFQMSIFFFALFSFLIFFVPVVLKRMGDAIFLLSGALSIFFIYFVLKFFSKFSKESFKKSKKRIIFWISTIFISVNLFYFLNIIPPIPLSLKSIGVYYSAEKLPDGGYLLREKEDKNWFKFLPWVKEEVLLPKGNSLFAFSSVFAPTDLKTNISHSWQYYNEKKGKWEEKSEIEFPILGGRDGGYRGYTIKRFLKEGLWRVDVLSGDGRLIGRTEFEIKNTDLPPKLETIYK